MRFPAGFHVIEVDAVGSPTANFFLALSDYFLLPVGSQAPLQPLYDSTSARNTNVDDVSAPTVEA